MLAYFIVCLLMGIRQNISECIRLPFDQEFESIVPRELHWRYVIYVPNMGNKHHPLVQILEFCRLHYQDSELMNDLNKKWKKMKGSLHISNNRKLTLEEVKSIIGVLIEFQTEIFIVVDQWNNLASFVPPEIEAYILGQLASEFNCLVLSSANFQSYSSSNKDFSKFEKVNLPLRSYSNDEIFKMFCLEYLRESQFSVSIDVQFNSREVCYIQEKLPKNHFQCASSSFRVR